MIIYKYNSCEMMLIPKLATGHDSKAVSSGCLLHGMSPKD